MSIQEKLNKGRDRLNKAGNDEDLLSLALTSIHGALEDACRNWLAAPGVKQQHGIDVSDRAKASWQNILELMPRYCGWSDRDVKYVRKMNSLRNKAAHGDGFEGTRQDVEQYLSFVENAIANGGAFTSSETSSSSTGQYFPNNIHQGGAVQPFKFQIERSNRGVRIFNRKGANIIENQMVYTKAEFEKFLRSLGLAVGALVTAYIVALIIGFFVFQIGNLLGIDPEFVNNLAGFVWFVIFVFVLWLSFRKISQIIPNTKKGVLITPDRIYIGKKSYSLPGRTYFRFIPQTASNLFKMHFIRSDSVVYFARNLTWHEADELLRIAVNANFMIEDSRSQYSVKLQDKLIFLKSLEGSMSMVIEHNDKLWQSLGCRMLQKDVVELTESEVNELHSKKLQEFYA